MGNVGELCVGTLDCSRRLQPIRRKDVVDSSKARLVLVVLVLFAATISWSQTPVTEESNPPQNPQQSPTPQSNPAPAPPADSGKPEQAPPPQDQKKATPPEDKKDDSQGEQTKRMFWVVPNFGAVNANTQLPPLSTHEKFVLAAKDSILDYSSYTLAAILAGQANALNSGPESGDGAASSGPSYRATLV